MTKSHLNLLWILIFISEVAITTAQVTPPDAFFPHGMGEHFTPHHLLVDYYEKVAEESPLVEVMQYGSTNQDRPLILAFVTSEANHAILEDIRKNNLKMAGIEQGDPDTAMAKSIVWLSFSVHGNEAAGSESAPYVLYDLVDPANEKTKAWLENTVVVLDPSINPDGYSRYTHWIRNVAAAENNTDINDVEHQEPWPGGRVNHYLFDLNRDWAWQTQVESQQRMKVYNQWLPHIHADLHEMGHENPYYFAPAAKPYHEYITEWQREFQVTIGKNHARYFDEEGWLYFTKEVFDLYYPSYGDTYPTFSGAIGMTYEQGGSRRGARGVKLSNGEILTLKNRIMHHKTTALSTIETGHLHRSRLLQEFQKFYAESSTEPKGRYKTYVVKRDSSGHRLKSLCALLDKQDIRYGSVSGPIQVTGYDYLSMGTVTTEVHPGDLVISALQPKSVLAQVLMNPSNELEDSLTYDITAWSLPYAYGLEAIATETTITPGNDLSFGQPAATINKAYAFMVPWTDVTQASLVAGLLKEGFSLRILPKPVAIDGHSFQAGTVMLSKADNKRHGQMMDKIEGVLNERGGIIVPVATGFSASGPDLGSNQVDLIKAPKILTLMGEGVGTNAFGQVKWYFDKVIQLGHTMVDIDQLASIDLTDYNTLVLPDGFYRIDNNLKSKLGGWVNGGGKLIVMGRATRNFADAEGFALKRFATDEEKKEDEKMSKEEALAARYEHYSDRERNFIKGMVPGAIFELQVDGSHPLGFGLGKKYHSLRTSNTQYPLATDIHNVIVHPREGGAVIGFAGSKIRKELEDTLVFGVEDKGRGHVVYLVDNPLFRGFWYNGLFLFSNALFMVN